MNLVKAEMLSQQWFVVWRTDSVARSNCCSSTGPDLEFQDTFNPMSGKLMPSSGLLEHKHKCDTHACMCMHTTGSHAYTFSLAIDQSVFH